MGLTAASKLTIVRHVALASSHDFVVLIPSHNKAFTLNAALQLHRSFPKSISIMGTSTPVSIDSLTIDLQAFTTSSDDDVEMSDALLKNDPFSNETSKRLFNAIDDLRNCGAGQDLDLPQVCSLLHR